MEWLYSEGIVAFKVPLVTPPDGDITTQEEVDAR